MPQVNHDNLDPDDASPYLRTDHSARSHCPHWKAAEDWSQRTILRCLCSFSSPFKTTVSLMEDLPYEIWCLIVQYLPVEEAKWLFSVSRALFNMAMDLRYREVYLPRRVLNLHRFKHGLATYVSRLREPLIAARPREVHILVHMCSPDQVVQGKQSVLKSVVKHFKRDQKSEDPQTKVLKEVVEVIPFLTSVTSLHITRGSEWSLFLNPNILDSGLFSNCWNTFGHQLKVLSLASPLEIFDRVVGQDLHLPCLEELSLHIYTRFRTTDANGIIATQVFPFIQRHQSTIHTLQLNIEEYTIDVSALLGPLESMNEVTSLDLSMSYTSCLKTDFIGLQRLLRARRHELHTLRIRTHDIFHNKRFLTFQKFFEHPCWHIPLPKLKTLDIEPSLIAWRDDSYAYLVRFKSSLTTLRLSPNMRWQYAEVVCLANILTSFEHLKCLELLVHGTSPALLALFATTVPQLETLRLFYNYRCATPEIPSNSSGLFIEQLRKYEGVFSSWNLTVLDYSDRPRTGDTDGRIEVALVDLLPNVQWFCGQYRDEFRTSFMKSVS